MNINYQKELDKEIERIAGDKKTLLIHSCCAPCSSYVLEYLNQYFDITVFYYNPNIYPPEEFEKRVSEQIRLIEEMPKVNEIKFIRGEYKPEVFFEMSRGLEDLREGGERCYKCYELRLRESAVMAKVAGFDYFTTTLSISPHKNAAKLNEIGLRLEEEYGVKYLLSDFKKKGGYYRSIELSKQYELYRQNFCGCVFSKKESMERENIKKD